MKVSLTWIFDHLQRPWTDFNVHEIVARFNLTTAEIERVDKVTLNISHFTVGTIVEKNENELEVFCPELSRHCTLPTRFDAQIGSNYLIFIDQQNVRWATLADWHSEKDALMPAVCIHKKQIAGGWKKEIEDEDYILHVDNKSITHRPDLWCHRGIAREFAAMYNIPMKGEKNFLASVPTVSHESSGAAQKDFPFSLRVKNIEECKTLAAAFISHIELVPSKILIASRLARIDSKPINAIVDLTNYVMFDIGQPMHAFDADKIGSSVIAVERARDGQTLELLDKQRVELTNDDLVISNGIEPLSLAGIMGGIGTAVQHNTHSLLIEAGSFNPGMVRKTALRLKKRTESSTRFEKSLDATYTVLALRRFLCLLKKNKIKCVLPENIVTFRYHTEHYQLEIEHSFIEKRLGCTIADGMVIKILQSLEFICKKKKHLYLVQVPSFRSSKDLMTKEDIVEEIGRYVGYNTIPLELPSLKLPPSLLDPFFIERKIRNYFSYACSSREVFNYAIYDEFFLDQLRWQPTDAVVIQNPLSQHWQKLVTSLVPHLLKNVCTNRTEHAVRFYEINRIWRRVDQGVVERKSIAGIVGLPKNSSYFYQLKNELEQFFLMLGIKNAVFKKASTVVRPWYHPYKTSSIYAGDCYLGTMGFAHATFTEHIFDGELFIFELDMGSIVSSLGQADIFVPLAKFPPTWLDVSLFIDQAICVDELKKAIAESDRRIFKVELIDLYEKNEWAGKRSITLRFYARDESKTLSHMEIEHLYSSVISRLQSIGAAIR